MFSLKAVALLSLAAAAEAFSLGAAPVALRPAARTGCPRPAARAPLGLRMSGDPKVMFDANEGWKPEHHKDSKDAAVTGNVDVGDYFEGDSNKDTTGFSDGAAATGGGAESRLDSLLSAKTTEVRTVERQTYGVVEFQHPKQAWKIDGTYESGDPIFDMKFNSADNNAQTMIYIEPSAMTFEDFLAGFTADSDPCFEVEPKSGTMNRRGAEGTDFKVTYTGSAVDKADKFATFVVMLPNDNFQWTYKLRVSFP